MLTTEINIKEQMLDESKKQLGEFGETIWSNVLACSGWHYVSLTKICEGGAPLARGSSGKLILPDFDAYSDGRNVFVEAKAKTRSVVFRKLSSERHGIDHKNYLHYQEIQRVSGRQCYIAVVELQRESTEDYSLFWSGSLLFQKLDALGMPVSEHMEEKRKVYWERGRFADLASFSWEELLQIASGSKKLNLKREIDEIIQ